MKIDHITLAVRSLADSMPYYRTLLPLLGFRAQKPHIWTDGDGFFLQFFEAAPDTGAYERYGPGLNHIGFPAISEAQVEVIRAKMIDAGFPAPDIQDLDGAKALFMKDPDGIRFEVTYYPEGAPVVD